MEHLSTWLKKIMQIWLWYVAPLLCFVKNIKNYKTPLFLFFILMVARNKLQYTATSMWKTIDMDFEKNIILPLLRPILRLQFDVYWSAKLESNWCTLIVEKKVLEVMSYMKNLLRTKWYRTLKISRTWFRQCTENCF